MRLHRVSHLPRWLPTLVLLSWTPRPCFVTSCHCLLGWSLILHLRLMGENSKLFTRSPKQLMSRGRASEYKDKQRSFAPSRPESSGNTSFCCSSLDSSLFLLPLLAVLLPLFLLVERLRRNERLRVNLNLPIVILMLWCNFGMSRVSVILTTASPCSGYNNWDRVKCAALRKKLRREMVDTVKTAAKAHQKRNKQERMRENLTYPHTDVARERLLFLLLR